MRTALVMGAMVLAVSTAQTAFAQRRPATEAPHLGLILAAGRHPAEDDRIAALARGVVPTCPVAFAAIQFIQQHWCIPVCR